MAQDPDEERIRHKAHELWEAEGHPHGRDLDHWEQAREIIAIEDSQASTLLPRLTGSEEPVEWRDIAQKGGDVPNLTDQGTHDLTDISRETVPAAPALRPTTDGGVQPSKAEPSAVKDAGFKGPASIGKSAAKLAIKPAEPVKTGALKTAKKKK